MKKINLETKILVSFFALSLLFFSGTNIFKKSLSASPELLVAEIALEEKLQEFLNLRPIKKNETADLKIISKSAISVLIDKENKDRTLFQKENEQKLPIASLAKLMTAWVVLEHYDLAEEITISKAAANQYGNIKKLEEGKTFSVEYLLYPLLMESSNAAAYALANDYQKETGEKEFAELMNQEAEKIGLNNTFFANPTGLDPEDSKTEINYSTANDLAKLAKKLLEKPLIWEILSLPKYSLYGPELVNTNRFLLDGSTGWQDKIIGGKTGYTDEAEGCLLLVLKAPKNQGYLINVILGADGKENRFEEMRKLVDWLKTAYIW